MGHWIRAGIAVRTHVLKWPELPWRPDSGQNRFLQILGFLGEALLPIAYSLCQAYAWLDAFGLAWMHTASVGCIQPPNAFGLGAGRRPPGG